MPKLTILGSANAVPTLGHENTHMVLVGESRVVLIDCVGTPTVRLEQAGVDPLTITDLILTHFHPDHVGGVPSLLMTSWLLGRQAPLVIHGLPETLAGMQTILEAYGWQRWPGFFPVQFTPIHLAAGAALTPVLDSPEVRIWAAPVRHLIPTIGLRLEFPASERALAYSCDTQPSAAVVQLAAGVDILIHEASGEMEGHSSPAAAGAVARAAEAGALLLIHYDTRQPEAALLAAARAAFPGPVSLAQDFMTLEF
jgi:ribonuclease Z